MRQPRSQCRFETPSATNFAHWMPDGKITSFGQEVFLHACAQRGMDQPIHRRRGSASDDFCSCAISIPLLLCYAQKLNVVRQAENSVFPCFFEWAAFHFPLSGMAE